MPSTIMRVMERQTAQLVSGFETRVQLDEGGGAEAAGKPSLEVVVPQVLGSYRKAVSAIHCAPLWREGDGEGWGLNGRRIFDACILVAQLEARRRGPEFVRAVAGGFSPTFEIRAKVLAKLAAIPGKNYQRLYAELDGLFDMSLRWNVVGEDKAVEWDMRGRFFSTLGFGVGKQKGVVRFCIPSQVLSFLLEPTVWARLSLEAMHGLRSAAAYALYQVVWKYVTTDSRMTAALPVATWVELIGFGSNYVAMDPQEGKRVVRYGDFKRRVLCPAIEQVNAVMALRYKVVLREIRSGNKVVRLQFSFVNKERSEVAGATPVMWPGSVQDSLREMGFADSDMLDLAEAYPLDVIEDVLERLRTASTRLRSAGRRIHDRRAYFMGILQNIDNSDGGDAGGSTVDQRQVSAAAEQAQLLAREREKKLKERFEQHVTATFAMQLVQGPAEVLARVIELFEESDEFSRSAVFVKKGWVQSNVPLMAIVRLWLAQHYRALLESILVNPQEQSFEAWLAWQLEQQPGANSDPSGMAA